MEVAGSVTGVERELEGLQVDELVLRIERVGVGALVRAMGRVVGEVLGWVVTRGVLVRVGVKLGREVLVRER